MFGFIQRFFTGEKEITLQEFKKLPPDEQKQIFEQKRIDILESVEIPQRQELENGLCGLKNLGNTCFMNAALQCLSNTEPMTRYLLEKDWIKDINPILTKSGGQLVIDYQNMLFQMWCTKREYFSPDQIKKSITRVNKTFVGYAQQDSQEFLSYFLDIMMDDTNKIMNKPYFEHKDYKKEKYEDYAFYIWDLFLKRNQSFIIDIFYGQYLTEINCPECKFRSINCDPFDIVTLNLPENNIKTFECYIVLQTYETNVYHVQIQIDMNISVKNVFNKINSYLSQEEEIEPFNRKDFLPFFQAKGKIVSKKKEIWKKTGEYVNKKSQYLFFLETRNKKNNLMIFDKETFEVEREVYLYMYQNDEYCGVEKIIKVGQETTSKQLYAMVLYYHYKLFQTCQLQKLEFLENLEITSKNQLYENLDKIFSEEKVTTESFYYIKDELDNILQLDDTQVFQYSEIVKINIYLNKNYYKGKIKFKGCKSVNYSDNQEVSLESCFKHFNTLEVLDQENMWYCKRCKDYRQAKIKRSIIRYPKIMVINLKRFKKEYFSKGYSNFIKMNHFIDFPQKMNLDFIKIGNMENQNTNYELYGVINHYGGYGGGHYTAYCKNFLDQQWYQYDDQTVEAIKESEVVTKAAYVLFYKQINQYLL